MLFSHWKNTFSVWFCVKSTDLDRLQSLQHKAIKLIFSANRFDSPAPLMNTLYWLPIRERINFKMCMFVFKFIHGNAPKYLSDFISHRLRPVTGPITRSSNDSTLIVAHVGRNCIDDKSLYVTAPHLWNALLRNTREAKSLTVFKKMLKSHLNPKYWLALCLYFALFFHICSRWKGELKCLFVYMYVWMYVCMYVCMHVCMYECMYLCMFISVY